MDSDGKTIEFMLSAKRDAKAAKRFFKKALRASHSSYPRVINVDRIPPTRQGIHIEIRWDPSGILRTAPGQASQQHYLARSSIHKEACDAGPWSCFIPNGLEDTQRIWYNEHDSERTKLNKLRNMITEGRWDTSKIWLLSLPNLSSIPLLYHPVFFATEPQKT